jgi:trehalose-6-phosphate synthase
MMRRKAAAVWSRAGRALAGPARLRDTAAVLFGSMLAAALIFGALYDSVDGAVRRWAEHDLERRAQLVASGVGSRAADASPAALQDALGAFSSHGDLAGLAACSPAGAPVATTPAALRFDCRSTIALAAAGAEGRGIRATIAQKNVAVTAHRLDAGNRLFVLQDRAFLDRRRSAVLMALFFSAEGAVAALLLLARVGARIGSRRTEEAARSLFRRMQSDALESPVPPELRLLVRDMQDTVAHMRADRKTALSAGAARLRAYAAAEVTAGGLVVLANREPYAHELKDDGSVDVVQPASGLVTGIEPVLRACGGTWIAHGGGSADRRFTDRRGRLAVPPHAPEYTLRRIWLGAEEYERYYSGLANEGLWPLCHMAHVQPAFRLPDWLAYQSVNDTFARAAVEEAAADGLVLVQDYHFALAPRRIRDLAPHLVTSLFWHIPWPNPEVVGICPWKETLLEGMIGADVVGFHTRQFCLNFLETAQRYLECRVDFDEMSISYNGHRTVVRPYPISVEWPYAAAPRTEGAELRRSLGIAPETHVSVGVDRADYTKGLVERIAAVELLLETDPSLIGRYVLVQLASPTRTRIRRYQQLADEVREAAERVNARFGRGSWRPVILQMRTFSPDEVRRHYAMADSALVTPLHDGMNLVAKEYAAACSDGNGALVLSIFAGAAKELEGALLVNPYDTQQVAQAILRAIRMPAAERRARMEAMRQQIAGSSIYDWTERLLRDMCEAREQNARYWPHRGAGTAPALREVAG